MIEGGEGRQRGGYGWITRGRLLVGSMLESVGDVREVFLRTKGRTFVCGWTLMPITCDNNTQKAECLSLAEWEGDLLRYADT